jgi:hypothetical protein
MTEKKRSYQSILRTRTPLVGFYGCLKPCRRMFFLNDELFCSEAQGLGPIVMIKGVRVLGPVLLVSLTQGL